MSDQPTHPSASGLAAEDVARTLSALGEGEAGLFAFVSGLSGRTEEIILLSESVAEELADLLGRFGDALTVRIFAAVTLTDLGQADIAVAAGADEATVAGQIARLESGGFLFHRDVGGARLYAAGNPPLKRFFTKRFAPDRRFHP
jgi:hypothetical protein